MSKDSYPEPKPEKNLLRRGWTRLSSYDNPTSLRHAKARQHKAGKIMKVVKERGRNLGSNYSWRTIYVKPKPQRQDDVELYEERLRKASKYTDAQGFSGAHINPSDPRIRKAMKQDNISYKAGMFVLPPAKMRLKSAAKISRAKPMKRQKRTKQKKLW